MVEKFHVNTMYMEELTIVSCIALYCSYVCFTNIITAVEDTSYLTINSDSILVSFSRVTSIKSLYIKYLTFHPRAT